MRAFRYGGRVLLVAGAALSVTRVVTAPEDEQVHVAMQETGAWVFSLHGMELGAEAGGELGAAFGIESGPGAVLTAAIGALVGGAIGLWGGEEAANQLYDVGADAAEGVRILGDPARLTETTTLMFGTPEDRRNYYEMRSIETGEPSSVEGF